MSLNRTIVKMFSRLLVCLMVSWPAWAGQGRTGIWDLVRKYAWQPPAAANPQSAGRVVRFPKDRSLGRLVIQDENVEKGIDSLINWWDELGSQWEYFGRAQGDVLVPPGKRLGLYVASGLCSDLSVLRSLDPNCLYMLSIEGPSYSGAIAPDDRCMPDVAHLTGLKVLLLKNTKISPKGIEALRGIKGLERLSLSSQATNRTLAEIVQLRSIKALYLMENRLTDAGLGHLARLPDLEELGLGQGKITDAGLAHVGKLPRLKYLMLQGKDFTDAGIGHLKASSSLTALHLGHVPNLGDGACVHISQMPGIEKLSFHWSEGITDHGIAQLKKLKSLKMLDILLANITMRGMADLAQIRTLTYLHLTNKILNDEALEYVSQLSNLRHLRIVRPHLIDVNKHEIYFTDAGLGSISKLKNLESLDMGSPGVTDKGMSHIAKLDKLRDLLISGCPISDDGLSRLAAVKTIERLGLSYTQITLPGIAQLGSLPNLSDLTVHGVERGGAGLQLNGLTQLRRLSITLSPTSCFTDADLRMLANLRSLETLHMSPSAFTERGVAHLAGLTEMEYLSIGGPELADDSLEHLAGMKRLHRLTVFESNITSVGLGWLAPLKSLNSLSITTRGRISPASRQLLCKELPALRILTIRPQADIRRR